MEKMNQIKAKVDEYFKSLTTQDKLDWLEEEREGLKELEGDCECVLRDIEIAKEIISTIEANL